MPELGDVARLRDYMVANLIPTGKARRIMPQLGACDTSCTAVRIVGEATGLPGCAGFAALLARYSDATVSGAGMPSRAGCEGHQGAKKRG